MNMKITVYSLAHTQNTDLIADFITVRDITYTVISANCPSTNYTQGVISLPLT